MKTSSFPLFPTEPPFPAGDFRAFVTDCYADELTDGVVTLYISLLLIDVQTNDSYFYIDTIVNDLQNPRSREFFDALETSNIKWTDYEELIGLTFDCAITYEQYDDMVLPILCKRKILAKPPCKED